MPIDDNDEADFRAWKAQRAKEAADRKRRADFEAQSEKYRAQAKARQERIEALAATAWPEIDQALQTLVDAVATAHKYKDLERLRALQLKCAHLEKAIRKQAVTIGKKINGIQYPPKRRTKEEMAKAREPNMVHQVIDAGYRTMAAKLHPDAGGSHEDMVKLNRTRDALKRTHRT